ncbi:hypothetical protein ACJJTC_013378 [Scirpophaga incertulas]
MDRCVNCGLAIRHCILGRRLLNDEAILTVFQQWLAPQSVSSSDFVCQACWNIAQNPDALNRERPLGHQNVCIRCGRSLASRVSHVLHTNTTRESRIYNVIQEWIIPRAIPPTSHICHACWVAADRASVHMISGPSTSSQQDNQVIQPQEQPSLLAPSQEIPNISPPAADISNEPVPSIVLTQFMRAVDTERKCFIEGCQRTERYRVPLSMRKMLFNQYKYYIPENNRLCDQHLVIESWDFMDSLRSNYVQTFTEKHINDM